jgi:glycosyltransferase involved in cell wall biosynthesis
MKILFVYGNMYVLGGVQTWLTRMLPRVQEAGHEVALLTRPPAEPWDTTDVFVEQLAQHATVHVGGRRWFSQSPSSQPPVERPDVIFACGLEALLQAGLLQRSVAPDVKVVAGVFSPREYCWKAPRIYRRWSQHLSERFVRRLPLENFMFSTEGMARQTGECVGRDLSASPVLPLPIDTDRFRPRPGRKVTPGKVVSVTRLVPYYTHHRQMINVIRDLREQGHEFSYHAHGSGPEHEALEAEAQRLGVADAVFFHGALDYDRFEDAMDDAFAYIGMGTALLEAAASGVPALVAIDSHPGASTYGFIQDTLDNDLGGHSPTHPEHEIAERLLWLASRAGRQYREVEAASRARAEEFSLVRLVPRFVEILARASRADVRVSEPERKVGALDWLLEAVMLKLGAPDVMGSRPLRRV